MGWDDRLVSGARSRRPLRAGDVAVLALVAVVCAGVLGVAGGALGLGIALRIAPEADPTGATTSRTIPPTPRPPDTIAGVASAALPSVVSVIVDAGFESGSGSGFVLRDGGYIVTNNHVIDAAFANDGRVEAVLADGRRLPVSIVGRNTSYDVAVLKVEGGSDGGDLVPIRSAEKQARVGDAVIAIGAPLGLDFTVTTGIVSALDRPVTVGEDEETSYISAIQTDAAINPGNSGGPLLEGRGRFLGMTSSIATLAYGNRPGSIGVGFAIPARAVERIADEIIATGSSRTPILGVIIDPTYAGTGALLASVTAEGPAAIAGLRAGDLIVELGGRSVDGAEELVVAIRDQLPGESVVVEALRQGRLISVRVILDGREDQ